MTDTEFGIAITRIRDAGDNELLDEAVEEALHIAAPFLTAPLREELELQRQRAESADREASTLRTWHSESAQRADSAEKELEEFKRKYSTAVIDCNREVRRCKKLEAEREECNDAGKKWCGEAVEQFHELKAAEDRADSAELRLETAEKTGKDRLLAEHEERVKAELRADSAERFLVDEREIARRERGAVRTLRGELDSAERRLEEATKAIAAASLSMEQGRRGEAHAAFETPEIRALLATLQDSQVDGEGEAAAHDFAVPAPSLARVLAHFESEANAADELARTSPDAELTDRRYEIPRRGRYEVERDTYRYVLNQIPGAASTSTPEEEPSLDDLPVPGPGSRHAYPTPEQPEEPTCGGSGHKRVAGAEGGYGLKPCPGCPDCSKQEVGGEEDA